MPEARVELRRIELGHAFMEVEQHRGAAEARADRGEHKPIGDGVHLYKVKRTPQVKPRQVGRNQQWKGEVFKQVLTNASASMMHWQSVNGQTSGALTGGLAGTAHADDVDGVTCVNKGM